MRFFFFFLNAYVAFKKGQIKYFTIIILIITSTFNVPIGHFVCYVRFFCYWVDSRDQNRFDFPKSETDLEEKSNRDQIDNRPKI